MAAVDQLALYDAEPAPQTSRVLPARPVTRLCAGCRAKEARYGFRDERHGVYRDERPRTLCFECFRMELARRQTVAARTAMGWNAAQATLPLSDVLESADRRRRQAQIAARKALGLA
jgi:hypothetical protein